MQVDLRLKCISRNAIIDYGHFISFRKFKIRDLKHKTCFRSTKITGGGNFAYFHA